MRLEKSERGRHNEKCGAGGREHVARDGAKSSYSKLVGKEELKRDWFSGGKSSYWYEMVSKTQAVQPVLSGPWCLSATKSS